MATLAPEQLLRQINEAYLVLPKQNYYERLGVSKDADARTIRTAYTKVAASWHPDRYSQYELGSAGPVLHKIFALFTEAHSTLSSRAKREEYDARLEFTERLGGQVDPRTIFQSDSLFKLGQQLLDSGKYKHSLEKFEEACRLNPDSSVFNAYRVYAEYQSISRDKEGVPLNKRRAVELREALEVLVGEVEKFDMGHVFVGIMYKGEGNAHEARRNFLAARALNSKNVKAQRQLRLMNMRADKKGSLMDRIKNVFKRD